MGESHPSVYLSFLSSSRDEYLARASIHKDPRYLDEKAASKRQHVDDSSECKRKLFPCMKIFRILTWRPMAQGYALISLKTCISPILHGPFQNASFSR